MQISQPWEVGIIFPIMKRIELGKMIKEFVKYHMAVKREIQEILVPEFSLYNMTENKASIFKTIL